MTFLMIVVRFIFVSLPPSLEVIIYASFFLVDEAILTLRVIIVVVNFFTSPPLSDGVFVKELISLGGDEDPS